MPRKPVKQQLPGAKRQIKRHARRDKTHPIKDDWQRRRFITWFSRRRDKAKTPYKRRLYDRDYMIVLTGLYTGLRAEDLLQLTVDQVASGRLVTIENKTNKEQDFELPADYYAEVLDYIKRYDLKPQESLFKRGTTGGKSNTEAVTLQRIDRVIKEAREEVGITHPVGMHGLRKTFAYMCVTQWGYALADVQIFLNHASQTTTEIYIDWTREDTDQKRAKMNIKRKL